jgi:hypothetical protein
MGCCIVYCYTCLHSDASDASSGCCSGTFGLMNWRGRPSQPTSRSGWCSATCATGAHMLYCCPCLHIDASVASSRFLDVVECCSGQVLTYWTLANEPFRVVLSHMRDRCGLYRCTGCVLLCIVMAVMLGAVLCWDVVEWLAWTPIYLDNSSEVQGGAQPHA